MKKKKLLIVDDDETTCLLITRTLSGSDFSIHTAYTYHDAVGAITCNHYDLVLLDIHLNIVDGIEKTGFDVVRDCPSFPFVVLTSTSDPRMVQQAEEVHSLGYLVKPIDRLHLATQLNIILGVAAERKKQTEALRRLHHVNLAIGLIAGKLGLSIDDAHEKLRKHCRDERIKMADYCEAEMNALALNAEAFTELLDK